MTVKYWQMLKIILKIFSHIVMSKNFKIAAQNIKQLLRRSLGAGMATDKIVVGGEFVDYMYRESPNSEIDSGWRFMSGTENQDYVDNPDNWAYYDLNTISNYDHSIIPFLEYPIGTKLERIKGTENYRNLE